MDPLGDATATEALHDNIVKTEPRIKHEIKLESKSNQVFLELGHGKVFYFDTEDELNDVFEPTSKQRKRKKEDSNIKSEAERVQGRTCHECDKKFASNTILIEHIDTQHNGVTYQCNDCQRQYRSKANLARHIKSKHQGVGNAYACDYCKYVCDDYSNMKRHNSAKHSGILFKCDICERVFNAPGNLQRHKKRHETLKHRQDIQALRDEGISYKCDICHQDFESHDTLKQHIKTHVSSKLLDWKMSD